jgi:N-acetylmuramoyl-L-alanine amidase
MSNKVGIIVGHNSSSKGAVNYLGVSEFDFNYKVAVMCCEHLKKLDIIGTVINRPAGKGYSAEVAEVAQKCKTLGITKSLELHFNSGEGKPLGCEGLVPESTTKEDNDFAKIITDLLNERLGIKERGIDGVKTIQRSDRGGGMLYGLKDNGITCVIVEPCFSNKSEESEKIFTNPDYYAMLLAEAVNKAYFKNNKVVLSDNFRVEAEALLQKIRQDTYNFYMKWNS